MIRGFIHAITWSGVAILTLVFFCRAVPDGIVRAADPDQSKPVSPSNPSKVAIYDPDPQHLWNRLYAALCVRTTDDGQSYGQDELDPLLWENSTYLLTESRYQQVLGLLNEFLDKRGEKLIAHPLKRALFQHDLWAIFDWLADPEAEHVGKRAHLSAERRALRNRLAPLICRLVLSVEQIETLPDNYSLALACKAYPFKQDPSHTDKAFLPSDLFDANGPWVHFQTDGGKPYPFGKPTALTHVHFVGGRSAFFVFINLPGGRQATLDFLQKLNTFPYPAVPRPGRTTALTLNPDLPPPPSGTKLALVRQMMVIDDRGKMRPTRLIESVQLRVVHAITGEDNDFYEFTLHRKELFDSNNGLRAGRSDQVTIPVFNHTHDEDIFDFPSRVRMIRAMAANRGKEPVTENLRFDCISCHKRPELASVNAFFHDRPPGLTASERGKEIERVIRWKGEKYNWGLLQGLIEEQQKK
jgi:hypothetical protein